MMITVIGAPAPQGSKRLVGRDGKGRGILVESSAKVKPWREAVKYAAIESGGGVAGAIEVSIAFTLRKPAGAPKRRKTWPSTRPDLSKLVRSTEDALVDAGVIDDDSRIVSLVCSKVFPNEGPDALGTPGAVIRIREAKAAVGVAANDANKERR